MRLQHAAVCRALGLLTPAEIQAIRERLGPTQAEFAQLTGIGEATISRWERGRILPNRAMDHYLRLLDRNRANVALLKTFPSPPADAKSGIVKSNCRIGSWHPSGCRKTSHERRFSR